MSYYSSAHHRDVAAFVANPASDADDFAFKYSLAEGGVRFTRLALIWSGLIGSSLVTRYFVRVQVVRGVAIGIIVPSLISVVLDAAAFRRDADYSARWSLVASEMDRALHRRQRVRPA